MEPSASSALRLPRLQPFRFARGQLSRTVRAISSAAREKRAQMFRQAFELTESTRILDLGSETGANIHAVLRGTPVKPQNVHICDIHEALIAEGAERYGFVPVHARDGQELPFDAQSFDIVYCSSVIEHVTLPKAEVWRESSGRRFRAKARERQMQFASEIRRLGRQYFVQTPYRHFPVESHSWLPFMGWLPRPALLPVLACTNKVWVKHTNPDWHLLDRGDIAELFPDARLLEEKFAGLTKSLIAVKSELGGC
ncbi:MAG TPA: class I SAM-dependent methyltransferase [Burkholderiales bacterium]